MSAIDRFRPGNLLACQQLLNDEKEGSGHSHVRLGLGSPASGDYGHISTDADCKGAHPQDDRTVTSMVPASVRVRREEASSSGRAVAPSPGAKGRPSVGPGFGLAPTLSTSRWNS